MLPALILITAIFSGGIIIQTFLRSKFCAICVAISGTWIALLSLRLFDSDFFGFVIDPAVIGVLMGESAIGLYFLLEKKVPESWQLFRFPYIVTSTILIFLVIGIRDNAFLAIAALSIIWIIFGTIFAFQKFPHMKKVMESLIACCRDW